MKWGPQSLNEGLGTTGPPAGDDHAANSSKSGNFNVRAAQDLAKSDR